MRLMVNLIIVFLLGDDCSFNKKTEAERLAFSVCVLTLPQKFYMNTYITKTQRKERIAFIKMEANRRSDKT